LHRLIVLTRRTLLHQVLSTIRAGAHEVPSPIMETMYQLLGLKTPLRCGQLFLKSDLDYFMRKYSQELCLELGLSVLLNLTLNTSPKPHLQKNVAM
jgi:hypothetical protein